MRPESNAGEDSPVAIAPEVTPRAPWRVTEVETLEGFRLRVSFADGLTGIVDLSAMLQSPNAGVFAALADPSLFAQVRLDYGTVTWPGELDLAPDAMHQAIREHGLWTL